MTDTACGAVVYGAITVVSCGAIDMYFEFPERFLIIVDANLAILRDENVADEAAFVFWVPSGASD